MILTFPKNQVLNIPPANKQPCISKKLSHSLKQSLPPHFQKILIMEKSGLFLTEAATSRKIAVALDPTDLVLKEAARMGADLLITHHTLIFDPINLISKRLSDTLKIAIENDISIYTMHTNYDKADGGVNDVLAELLDLNHIINLPLGRIGEIQPMKAHEFASFIARRLDTHVQYKGDGDVKKVMVVGGSGFRREYIDAAIENGVDALVSGEMRHDAQRYADGLCLFDATHYATEAPWMRNV